jgi:PAS domain S-box-containing protein
MKRLLHALSRTNDGAFIIDGQHRIIFWNQAAEKILGHTAEEVVGRLCFEILGGRDGQGHTLCQRYCQIAIQANKGDILPNTDVYARTRKDNGRWLNVTTFVYPNGDKAMEEVIVHLFRDATKKKNYQNFVDSVLTASEQLQQNHGHRVISATPAASHIGKLTPRQRQVLELLAEGLGTNEISERLVISPATVRNHVQNILEKLGAHSRLEAIAQAYQQGLIEVDRL